MLKKNEKYLSIIIPILNEAKNISCLVPKISKVIKKNYKNYELIIIDDNSQDNIYDVINELKKKFKFLKFIQQKNKKASQKYVIQIMPYWLDLYQDHLKNKQILNLKIHTAMQKNKATDIFLVY